MSDREPDRPSFQAECHWMNKKGHRETLGPRHEGNTNAVTYGVHSPGLISERAKEISEGLLQAFDFTPTERVAVGEVARWAALLEAIDRDLDERGLVDRRGKERYLLALRVRASARLERWLAKLESAMNRDWREAEVPELKREHYLRELERIALGQDPTATAHDRLGALRELLRLGPKPSHLAAVQVLLKEGEVEGVEPDEQVDAREPGGETDNPGHPAHS
jgi:hypothetical protein